LIRNCFPSGAAASALIIFGFVSGVAAQSVDDNAVKQAEDAFGTKVGLEDIGLYTATSARGFNPQDAGNMRLEGIYFDQRTLLCTRILKTSTMRVGLPAQAFAFPAPTGIVDIAIYQPAPKWSGSVAAQVQAPHGISTIGGDVKGPITDKIGIYSSIASTDNKTNFNGRVFLTCGAVVGRWTPSDKLQITPFFTFNDRSGDEAQPLVLPSGPFVPPRIDRKEFFGQEWADRTMHEMVYGSIVRAQPSEAWSVNAGLFHSIHHRSTSHSVLFRNVSPQGVGNLDIVGYPELPTDSWSGEVRATGVYTQGNIWQHTINFSVRGRDTNRLFGGSQTVNFGQRMIGVNDPVSEPRYVYGARDADKVRQITPGAAYTGRWADVGSFSVGLQKSFYRRDLGKENAAAIRTESQPWLYYSTFALYATDDVTLFGSYMKGLEEFGVAPDNAVNGGEPLPAAQTKQIDAGVRYQIKPGLAAVVSVFEITKPHFDRNTVNVFTNVGELSHQGLELSLTGRLSPSWTMVAGALFLKPRVSGLPVDQGLLGKVPPGTPVRSINLNAQFSPPSWKGAALDATLEVTGRYYANRLNTLRMPGYETLNIGARYPFRIGATRAALRLLVNNITNVYAWTVDGASGRFAPISPTTYMGRVVLDF
jgi:iron complex outermembrane recepter protein